MGPWTSPWSSASRPPATRPASGSCAATRCWPTRSRAASTSTPASAASCPRSPAGPTSRRWCRPSSGPARPPASGSHDVDAIAVTSGPGPRRRAAGRRRRGQGARARRSASRCTASTTSPPTSPSTSSSTGRCPSRAWRCWSPAATPACCGSTDVTGDVDPLGATIDDAAGEAFDKVARLLGLPFPGGPHIDRAAREGDTRRDRLPARADRAHATWSGTASTSRSPGSRPRSPAGSRRASGPASRCRSPTSPRRFQEAVCDVLTRKALDAAATEGVEDLLIGGGVAANSRLRAMAEERAADAGASGSGCPRPGLCTDNGAMVAALGAEMVAAGPAAVRARPAGRLLAPRHRGAGLRVTPRRRGSTGVELAPSPARGALLRGRCVRTYAREHEHPGGDRAPRGGAGRLRVRLPADRVGRRQGQGGDGRPGGRGRGRTLRLQPRLGGQPGRQPAGHAGPVAARAPRSLAAGRRHGRGHRRGDRAHARLRGAPPAGVARSRSGRPGRRRRRGEGCGHDCTPVS